jgi:signal transduction histidine kinase
MKNKKINFFKSLKWKITALFLLLLFLLSVIYLYISVSTAEKYFQETSQKLNIELAKHIADETQCFIDGNVNQEVLKNVFHNVMVINPSIEVYLLDTTGTILTYFALDKKIKLKQIPLEPINSFIQEKGENFILGQDPRNKDRRKAFSAAKVFEGDKFMGYMYVILGGEEYDNATELVFGSYILQLGLRSMTITLLAAIIISIISIRFIMRNLNKIITATQNFKNGNLNARIKINSEDELGMLANSFNEMAEKIVQNIAEIKTMDNLRRDLVANVSHDLRTPLATIQGYVETLMIKSDSIQTEERNKHMQTILDSTERLKKLVEELFELSKLEAKEKIPKPEAFSLAELIQDIKQKNEVIASKKNINLSVKFEDKIPFVFADIGMMERIIQNLLDNAIKFTSENGEISINLKRKDKFVEVDITDSGRGIASADLPNIFDRYHKEKRIEKKTNKGLGLGLAIVKKMLEVHNLEISVQSKLEKGTSFIFNVPICEKEEVTSEVYPV